MIIIKELRDSDLLQTLELRALCWPEELAGLSNHKLNVQEEFEFWSEWMHNGVANNDVRVLIGAFENGMFLGAAFASFAEECDIKSNGIDLNGLWVYPQHRGRGVSLLLLVHLLNYYETIGIKQMSIYNFHHSPSNSFYRKFGASVLRTEYQLKEQLPVDVFICDIQVMKNKINASLTKYVG